MKRPCRTGPSRRRHPLRRQNTPARPAKTTALRDVCRLENRTQRRQRHLPGGHPQVQIWDVTARTTRKKVGSGGLYNNQKNPSDPLLVADNKVGALETPSTSRWLATRLPSSQRQDRRPITRRSKLLGPEVAAAGARPIELQHQRRPSVVQEHLRQGIAGLGRRIRYSRRGAAANANKSVNPRRAVSFAPAQNGADRIDRISSVLISSVAAPFQVEPLPRARGS